MSDAHPPRDIPADELADYLRLYLDETGEQLDQLVQVILALEADAADAQRLNEAFRLVHSIKGSAALMGFDRITVLAHHLESHFERLRSGSRRYDAVTTDVALRCIDHLRECNARLRQGEPIGGDPGLLEAVESLAGQPDSGETVPRPEAPAAPAAPAPTAPLATPGPQAGAPGHDRRLRITVRFTPGLPLAELRTELVLARLRVVGRVLESFVPPGEPVLEVVLATALPDDAVRSAAAADGVEAIVIAVGPPESPAAGSAQAGTAAGREPGTGVGRDPGSATLRVDIVRLDALLNLAGELLLQRSRFARIVTDLTPAVRKAALPGQLGAVADGLRAAVGRLHAGGAAAEVLPDLEGTLGQLDEQLRVVRDVQRQVVRLAENTDRLARLADQLQRSVLRTRMVPVAPLFNRFKRSVRDIATELGKQVRLECEGEQTELDKRTIDELGDPLVHLIRNAIDHGIEPPEERLAAGKPALATLGLAAAHVGNSVLVTVRDDGRGIDTERIRRRLVDRGQLAADQAAALGTEELIDTIWQPGFSTAGVVSGISGRGVGMDIVRTRITALGGTVEVRSTPGGGTTFVMRLPLTLAIAHCLLFRVPQGVFAAALDDVREIVALGPGQVVDVRGRRACEIRGVYLPLVTIEDLFTWAESAPRQPASGFAVVLQSGGRAVALAVDELVGREDLVVKSLAVNFVPLRGLGGAGILGDGSVCLLLDTGTVLGLAGRSAEGGAVPAPAGG